MVFCKILNVKYTEFPYREEEVYLEVIPFHLSSIVVLWTDSAWTV